MNSDSDANTAENKAPQAETGTKQATPSVKWIVFCSVLAVIVVTPLNLFIIDYLGSGAGLFYWIPALVCSVLLALVLTTLRVSHRRVYASLLSAALTIPISLFFLYFSLLGVLLYGFSPGS